jgi:hypothetical protein
VHGANAAVIPAINFVSIGVDTMPDEKEEIKDPLEEEVEEFEEDDTEDEDEEVDFNDGDEESSEK